MTEKILIKTPQMGESIMEGTVLLISKKPGDFIEKDKVLFELETEKVTIEVVSTIDGIIDTVFVKLDQVVKVGSDLVSIIPSEKKIIANVIKKEEEIAISEKPNISPSAYKIAIENNVNLSTVKASGSKGHILKEDVLFENSGIEQKAEDELIDFSIIRKNSIKTAQNSQYLSISSFIIEKINVTKIVSLEEQQYLSIFIKAFAICLEKYPTLNALVFDDKILFKKQINIALQTSTSLKIIGDVANQNAKQIMDNNSNENESTVSVLYAPNSLIITPNIFENQAIAIAICRNESCHSSTFVNICIVFDNRAVSNIDVADFLAKVKKLVENPHLMLFL